MSHLRIGIDCDGVLCDFSESLARVANRIWPARIPPDYAPTSWDYEDVFSKEDWSRIWKEITATHYFWYDELPLDGMFQLRKFLEATRDIETYFITSRITTGSVSALRQTKLWLEKYGLYPRDHFSHVIVVSSASQKAELIKQHEIKFYLDDYAPTIQSLLGAEAKKEIDCESYLLDAPYNHYAAHLPRVWSVAEYLNKVANE